MALTFTFFKVSRVWIYIAFSNGKTQHNPRKCKHQLSFKLNHGKVRSVSQKTSRGNDISRFLTEEVDLKMQSRQNTHNIKWGQAALDTGSLNCIIICGGCYFPSSSLTASCDMISGNVSFLDRKIAAFIRYSPKLHERSTRYFIRLPVTSHFQFCTRARGEGKGDTGIQISNLVTLHSQLSSLFPCLPPFSPISITKF